ncbi:uncharacterized protein G2W53_039226 [Senna tora]|uniref:Uncharacterized protein n=1 Tax=Senna tora TaxID=362788 RepID=A0A834W2M9_9FABA|nr:uncharacterized protein G2W53_039226 [Senna tora]
MACVDDEEDSSDDAIEKKYEVIVSNQLTDLPKSLVPLSLIIHDDLALRPAPPPHLVLYNIDQT